MQGPVLPDGPAWLVGIALAGWVLVSIVKTVATIKRNGHVPPEIAALAADARQHFQAHTSVLNAVAITLSTLAERMAHITTREDLTAAAEKNRHEYRATLTLVSAEIRQDLRELHDDVRALKEGTP
jgi:hypothetical protein